MSRIRGSDTSIELAVRRYLFSRGFRYRLNYPLPGKPDIVFPGKKTAVFVNGCFWHMHGCRLSAVPKTRRDFWETKLRRNVIRDSNIRENLKALGWKVITIWECELEKDLDSALDPLLQLLSPDSACEEDKTEVNHTQTLGK